MIISLFCKALVTTLGIVCITVSLGLLIGTAVAFVRVANQRSGSLKILNTLITGYVYLFRGTPLALQLLILVHMIESSHSEWLVTILGVGLNSGSYLSEVIRGNALAVDYGQYEKAQILGFSPYQALKLVIFPQALKNSIPSLLNEFSALVKETAVISGTVGLIDLTGLADNLQKEGNGIWPYYIAGILYLIVVVLVTLLVKHLGKYFENRDIEKGSRPYIRKQ